MTKAKDKDVKPEVKPEVVRYQVVADELSVGGVLARKAKGDILSKGAVKALEKAIIKKEVDGKLLDVKALDFLLNAKSIKIYEEPKEEAPQ